ncbi:hypothetical protein [Litorivivens sp.]|uniref:hypothetical protein n=1 Tax=Litorivivens sp. TaxID=2020868 RepID=UPI003568B93E
MLDEFTKARIRRASKDNPELPIRFIVEAVKHQKAATAPYKPRAVKAHFRPSTKRLKEIAQHGNDLMLSATDKELSGFSE